MYLQLMICDNVCQVWPWKAKRAWRWTGRVKWLSSCPHKPLCSGTYNDNNFWVIWMYCRFLKRISFKNIWPQIFWVLWQGIFILSWKTPGITLHCLGLVVHVFIWSIPSRKSGKGGQILHFTFHSCFRAHLQVVINAYGMFENYYIEFTIKNSCSKFIRKQLYTAKSLSYMLYKLSTFIILVTWLTAKSMNYWCVTLPTEW